MKLYWYPLGDGFTHVRRTVRALLGLALLALVAGHVAAARAATGFYIKGAGDGHGIGMSQYGALGFAEHGWTYSSILGHYYQDTTLATVSPTRTVTVLLQDGSATFRGATRAGGSKTLRASSTYAVVPSGSGLEVISGGRTIGTFGAPLVVAGRGPLDLVGVGRYRGSLIFRQDGSGGVETVNAVGLDQYVQGVIAGEMPAGWPAAALEAQAVAARTYAITVDAAGADFDVYDDARSQMYGGVGAETPATNAAVAATRGEVVEYSGTPATTYFFASSGGYTESIQNVWLGVTPEAWLHGVPDPYDDSGGNPYYRWKDSMSLGSASRKLAGLLKGNLEGIKILEHGVSPRIVKASVVGSRGATTVTGAQLQQLFGTMSTYMAFTTISSKGTSTSSPAPSTPATPGSSISGSSISGSSTAGSSTPSGGSSIGSDIVRAAREPAVSGAIFPGHAGEALQVQVRRGARWVTVATGRLAGGGTYRVEVPSAGRYRVVVAGIAGPVTSVA